MLAAAAVLALALQALPAHAHLGNISYSDIDVSDRGAVLRLKYAAHLTPGFPTEGGGKLSRAQVLGLQDSVQAWMQETVELRVAEGRCTPSVDNLIGPDLNDDLQVIVLWKCPAQRIPSLRVTFRAFNDMLKDWQNIASVRFAGQSYSTVFTPTSARLTVGAPMPDAGDGGAGSGETGAEPRSGAGRGDAEDGGAAGREHGGDSSADAAGTGDALRRFFELGVEHIWTGYDHLLFLFGVLLAGGGIRRLVAIVTSFTVAHSITLALAALGLVQLPSGPVEVVIALSIVYVAVENILGWAGDRRALVTFLFGLIHGFGFAGILAETGLPPGGVAVPLLAFNLGVEAGQLVVLVIVVPVLRLLLRGAAARPLTIVLSGMIALAGLLWAIERIGALA
ncbi:MAG TPA: HupE/UreJ family protein [Candidatus Limnocylindrales bacterium]|nr:HupE/UreJ family protein [Candidatus Limnocylindrales bacterium]